MPEEYSQSIILATDLPLGDDVFHSTVPASIRTPSRKKKSIRYGTRDSLRSRLFPGKPGTRRHQRHLNRTFLTDRIDEVEAEDWFVPDAYPTFFSNEQNMEAWKVLMEITEDQLQEFFSAMEELSVNEPQPKRYTTAFQGAQAAYAKIDKQTRACMKRHSGSPRLTELDIEILAFANSSEKAISFQFDHSPHRLVCHGICQYYSLISQSVTNKAGVRTTLIYKPDEHTIPTISLTEFMATL
eukprot:TRINITY_DN1255_c0_g1_i1.p1 TRINITY_DN1255_c0_g1~~TRINITY_DN1255_c0_g1_i1.p1  ORF type:complete len:241 (+),score=38.75 TRINITY_DN1255_c0_g1_i1:84-806(+)